MLINAVTTYANAAAPPHSIPRNPGKRAVLLVLPFVTALLTSSLMLTKIVAWKYFLCSLPPVSDIRQNFGSTV